MGVIWKVLFKIVYFNGSFHIIQTPKFPRLRNWARDHIQGEEAYSAIKGLEKIKVEETFQEELGAGQGKEWGAI